MAATTTLTELNGLVKRVYADKIGDLIPDNAILVKAIEFTKKKRLGDTFEYPVILANEHGVTYASAGSGAFTLDAPVAMTMQNARIPSVQMVLRSRMDYETASKAVSGGERAFRSSTELLFKSMADSMTHRLECSMLYGGIGLGKIGSTANASATSTVLTISNATWAIGIWAGCENARIDIYESTVQINTNSACTISAVDPVNKTLTITGNATDIALIDTEANGTGDLLDIYWDSSYGNDMNGIDTIITNTGSLFGINAGTYNLWRGNTYAQGGAITLAGLLQAPVVAVGKGLRESVCAYLSPTNFAVINNEMEAYRRTDSSYTPSKGTAGNESIYLYGQNGVMEIKPHSMVKDGEAFIGPNSTIKRVGSTDVTFNTPGMGDKFFLQLDDSAGFELRNYSDQAIFITEPGKWTKMTGITVS
jgi:hypothetical protein